MGTGKGRLNPFQYGGASIKFLKYDIQICILWCTLTAIKSLLLHVADD